MIVCLASRMFKNMNVAHNHKQPVQTRQDAEHYWPTPMGHVTEAQGQPGAWQLLAVMHLPQEQVWTHVCWKLKQAVRDSKQTNTSLEPHNTFRCGTGDQIKNDSNVAHTRRNSICQLCGSFFNNVSDNTEKWVWQKWNAITVKPERTRHILNDLFSDAPRLVNHRGTQPPSLFFFFNLF